MAVRRTLKEEEQLELQRLGLRRQALPAGGRSTATIRNRQAAPSAPGQPAALWQVVNQIGGKEGYFFGNLLWKTAGRWTCWSATGWRKVVRSRHLQTGDTVDSWKVIIVEPEKQLTLLFGMKAPGLGRLSFTLRDKGDRRELDVAPGGILTACPGCSTGC
jgi:hypothetical protein